MSGDWDVIFFVPFSALLIHMLNFAMKFWVKEKSGKIKKLVKHEYRKFRAGMLNSLK